MESLASLGGQGCDLEITRSKANMKTSNDSSSKSQVPIVQPLLGSHSPLEAQPKLQDSAVSSRTLHQEVRIIEEYGQTYDVRFEIRCVQQLCKSKITGGRSNGANLGAGLCHWR